MDMDYNEPEDFAADDSFINYCFGNRKEDAVFWEKWLTAHPDKKGIAEKARYLVFMMSIKIPPEKKNSEWEKVQATPKQEEVEISNTPHLHGRRRLSIIGLTAGISLLIIIGVALFYLTTRNQPSEGKITAAQPKSYSTSSGQRHSIVLKDGTRVWLNADSRLICHNDFNTDDTRDVTLTGEAYFEVAPDAERPFIIHTSKLVIKVLGTVFNVKDYPKDKTVEADLIKGSIEVSLNRDPARKIILRPHEKIIVYNHNFQLKNLPVSTKTISVPHDSMERFTVAPLRTDPLLDSGTVETAWMEGKLAFRNESFDQLTQQMERKYGVHFHFTSDKLKAYRFTGIFSTETIDQALHALQLTSPSDPFDYKVEGKEVFIERNRSK